MKPIKTKLEALLIIGERFLFLGAGGFGLGLLLTNDYTKTLKLTILALSIILILSAIWPMVKAYIQTNWPTK